MFQLKNMSLKATLAITISIIAMSMVGCSPKGDAVQTPPVTPPQSAPKANGSNLSADTGMVPVQAAPAAPPAASVKE